MIAPRRYFHGARERNSRPHSPAATPLVAELSRDDDDRSRSGKPPDGSPHASTEIYRGEESIVVRLDAGNPRLSLLRVNAEIRIYDGRRRSATQYTIAAEIDSRRLARFSLAHSHESGDKGRERTIEKRRRVGYTGSAWKWAPTRPARYKHAVEREGASKTEKT